MSIADEISRLQGAKADLKTAIEGKGVTVPSTTKLDGYAALVDEIETESGPYDDWVRPISWPDLDSIDYTDFDGYYLTYDLDQPCESPKISICVQTTDSGAYLAERGTLSNGVFTAVETYENNNNAEFHHDLDRTNGTIQLWRVTAKTGKIKIGIFSAINSERCAGYQPCVEKYQRVENLNASLNAPDIMISGYSRPVVSTFFLQHDRWMGTMPNQTNLNNAWRAAINIRLVDFRDAVFSNANFTSFAQSFLNSYGGNGTFDSRGASFPNCTNLQLAFNYNSLRKIDLRGFANVSNMNRFAEYSYACVEFYPPASISADTLHMTTWLSLSHDSLLRIISALVVTETTKTLGIGANNLSKLTAEEIAVATGKGWTVS